MLRKNITGRIQIFSTATGLNITVPKDGTFDDSRISGSLDENMFPIISKKRAIKTIIKNDPKEEKKVHFFIESFGTNLFYLNACIQFIQQSASNITIILTPFDQDAEKNRIKNIQSALPKEMFNTVDIINTAVFPYKDKSKEELFADLVLSLGIKPGDIVFKINDSDVFYEFEKNVSLIKSLPAGEHTFTKNVFWKQPDTIAWKEKKSFLVVQDVDQAKEYLTDTSKIIDKHFDNISPLQSFAYVNSVSYIKKYIEHKQKDGFLTDIDLDAFISLHKNRELERGKRFNAPSTNPFAENKGVLENTIAKIDVEGYRPLVDAIPFVFGFNQLSVVFPILDVNISDDSIFEFLYSFNVNAPTIPIECVLLSTPEFAQTRLKHVLQSLNGYNIKVQAFQFDKETPYSVALNNVMLKTKAKYMTLVNSFSIIKDHDWFNKVKDELPNSVVGYTDVKEKGKIKDAKLFTFPRSYMLDIGFSQGDTVGQNIKYLYDSASLYGYSHTLINNTLSPVTDENRE